MGRHRTCRVGTMVAFVLALAVWAAIGASAYAGEAAGQDMIKLGPVKGVSIPGLIDMVARDLNVNFLMPDTLAGTKVTMKWDRPLPKAEALDILRTVLDDEGFVLVETPYFLIVKPKGREAYAMPDDVVILPGEQELGKTDKTVTAIIVLEYIDSQEIFNNILTQLKEPTTYTAHLQRMNTIIIKDTESRVRYYMEIIDKLDVPGTTGMVTVHPIEYADAQELAVTLREVIEHQGTGGADARRGGAAGPGGVPVMTGPGVERMGVNIIHDKRLNSIIIVASERDTERVLELVEKLDVPPNAKHFPVHIFQCKNQQAVTLADVLRNFSEQRPPLQSGQPGGEAGRGAASQTEVFFIADEATNKILVSASPLDWEVYRDVLEELDQPQQQVLVEVWIVEVSSDDQFGLGVEWQTRSPSASTRIGPSRQEVFGGTSLGLGLGDVFEGNGLNRGVNVAVRSMTNTRVTIGGKTYIIPDIDAYLKALAESSDVKVLSSPKLLAINNEEASVEVTDQISISAEEVERMGDSNDVVRTFNRESVGITLKFTPQINADGFVIMDVNLEVSSVVGASITEAGARPVIAERKTVNKVRVEDGRTIVISGLRRHDRSNTITRVPLLGRIPLIGLLFRSKSTIDLQTNLMIFITPHIVTETVEMEAITEQMQGQDIEIERDRLEIEPKRWRRLQRKNQREAGKETNVWQR